LTGNQATSWPYSSYDVLTGNQATFVKRDVIRDWFGDIKELFNSQQMDMDANSKVDILDDN